MHSQQRLRVGTWLAAGCLFVGLLGVAGAKSTKAPPAPRAVDLRTALHKKLEAMVVPQVSFADTEARMVLKWLQVKVKEADPEGRGFNVVCRADPAVLERKVTMDFTEVPVTELLRYLGLALDVDVTIEEYAIVLAPKPPPAP